MVNMLKNTFEESLCPDFGRIFLGQHSQSARRATAVGKEIHLRPMGY